MNTGPNEQSVVLQTAQFLLCLQWREWGFTQESAGWLPQIFPLDFSKASALLTGKKKKETGLEEATIHDVQQQTWFIRSFSLQTFKAHCKFDCRLSVKWITACKHYCCVDHASLMACENLLCYHHQSPISRNPLPSAMLLRYKWIPLHAGHLH